MATPNPTDFSPHRAEARFGCGLSPHHAPAAEAQVLLERLAGPDADAARFPIMPFAELEPQFRAIKAATRARKRAKTEAEREELAKAERALKRALRGESTDALVRHLQRRALGADGLRTRLTAFWADHFTVVGRDMYGKHAYFAYVEEAVRAHVTGRFGDMLKAVAVQPVMLRYLNQLGSVGPNSEVALRREKGEGLNENLAREMLELHTLGVDGPYDQADVRAFAELLTGLSYDVERGFSYRPDRAEPGAEVVLGVSYGGAEGRLDDILSALDDLARHPATAEHLARKLVTHFVSDTPDPALVAHVAAAYRAHDGDLMPTYAALLEHPAAWAGAGNVKQPLDFIGSSLRALDLTERHFPVGNRKRTQMWFEVPLTLMGQRVGHALAPDGWPEDDEAWITPQRLAARLQWAMTLPFNIRKTLPDPRDFVEVALGPLADEATRFAARSAEARVEGVGVVLASPAFQRM